MIESSNPSLNDAIEFELAVCQQRRGFNLVRGTLKNLTPCWW
ncbi:hypothetical protein O9992_28080 [Vibrio lentus]|nr:hypothetical protein [Vibrio lentus]